MNPQEDMDTTNTKAVAHFDTVNTRDTEADSTTRWSHPSGSVSNESLIAWNDNNPCLIFWRKNPGETD